MSRREEAAILVAGLAIATGGSYLLALAGEPQAYWFWHTVLGAL